MKRIPLDENERVSVLLDRTDELHKGTPVVLQPYSELQDEICLTEAQARCLYEILQARYGNVEVKRC